MGDLTPSIPEPLGPDHHLETFDCGKASLNEWLRARALSNQQRGFTAIIVTHVDMTVVGYYGLAPTAVTPTTLPRSVRSGQPPNPIPCLLLGQLAIDRRWAGHGIGTGLLKHALERCVQASQLIGGRALLVRAIDDDARAFWRRRGFHPTRDDAFLLFRPLQDIAASLVAARAPRSHRS